MRAAVYQGIEKIEVQDWKKPECGAGEILIEVHYCAVCGTDVRIFFHGHKKVAPPAIIGHEISGIVAAVGPNASAGNVKAGDRVTVVTSVGCGRCKVCRDGYYNLCPDTRAIGYYWAGGFAEYLVVPEEAVKQNAVLKLPEKVSLRDGTLIEPLSCAINGQNYLEIKKSDTVVIFGGGPIGLMHAVLAQAEGAEKVIVVDPAYDRLQKFGSQFPGLLLWDPAKVNVAEAVLKETGGCGADVVITACPVKKAQTDGLALLGSRGRISLFGGLPKDDSIIQIDANVIHYKELSVFGSFASNRRDYEKAAALISSGKVDARKFISKVLPLEQVGDGISLVRNGAVLKAVIQVKKDAR